MGLMFFQSPKGFNLNSSVCNTEAVCKPGVIHNKHRYVIVKCLITNGDM